MLFNPIRQLEGGFSEEMIRYFVETKYEADRPMGNVAIHTVEKCVFGILVGRYEAVERMLPEAVKWIGLAESRGEKLGDNGPFYRSRMSEAKGIAHWLIDGFIHEGDWEDARVFGEAGWRHESRPWTRHEIVRGSGLDDYMAFAYLAGPDSWEAGIEMYEYWMGERGKLSLSGKVAPKKVAYALCLEGVGRLSISGDKLFDAGRRMLRANLQGEWLGGGQGLRAATWLKIVHGMREPELDPVQTILRAYDDMPDVEPLFRKQAPASAWRWLPWGRKWWA